MAYDVAFYAVMAVSVTILGLSKGGFAGIGIVSTPMVAAVSDPLTAAGIMLPIMILQDLMALFLYRRSFDRGILRVMLPGGLLGVVSAYLLAKSVPEAGIKAVLGGVSLVFSIWQIALYFRGAPEMRAQYRYDTAFGFLAGVAGGFTSAIAHVGSPPYQIYAMPKQLRTEIYVGTSVVFFAALNAMKLPSFAMLGLFSSEKLAIGVIFAPLALASSWAGAVLVRHIDAQKFKFVITMSLVIVSLILIVQSISK